MLNFAADDSNIIRALAHDLFMELRTYWPECDTSLEIDVFTDDLITTPYIGPDKKIIPIRYSIASSELAKHIIDSVFKLICFSLPTRKEAKEDIAIGSLTIENKECEKNPFMTKYSAPVPELLMTIYLYAFPFDGCEVMSCNPDCNDLEVGDSQEDEEACQVIKI